MKQRLLALGVLACIGALGFFAVQAVTRDTKTKPPKEQSQVQLELETFRDSKSGLYFSYDKSMIETQQLSSQDAKARIVFRATEPIGEAMPFLVTARYEEGLRTVASISRMDPLDIILDGAERTLPTKFPDFHKVSSDKFERHGKDVAELVYTYRGPSGDVIKQKLYVLLKDGNQAAYITVQAKAVDFEALDKKLFNTITQSLDYM